MTYTIGEVRSAMIEKLLARKLYDIASDAHREKNLNEFWIILAHKPDKTLCNVIREGITVTNVNPPKMIGAQCWHIVWDRGIIEPEYILPLDITSAYDEFLSDDHSSMVYDDVKSIGSRILS